MTQHVANYIFRKWRPNAKNELKTRLENLQNQKQMPKLSHNLFHGGTTYVKGDDVPKSVIDDLKKSKTKFNLAEKVKATKEK